MLSRAIPLAIHGPRCNGTCIVVQIKEKMGIFQEAADSAAASTAKVAASTGTALYGLSSLPLSSYAAFASIVLSVFYIWGALPRVARTAVALKRGVVDKDWSLWRKLGDQPAPKKDD
ncbi:hypothetical protein DO62_5195 [Burkholderia pseudomallei]|nr:hypothetical protein DO62_5195 [Burkholderia pseudomallei]KGS76692.1 hypothetical protein X947_5091 [Burkholderia pseudomallei MSHR7334]KGV49377.1 hypothetical protein X900_5679 [Burkholderia pseudomallei BDU 2]